jgi:hypothetical protein
MYIVLIDYAEYRPMWYRRRTCWLLARLCTPWRVMEVREELSDRGNAKETGDYVNLHLDRVDTESRRLTPSPDHAHALYKTRSPSRRCLRRDCNRRIQLLRYSLATRGISITGLCPRIQKNHESSQPVS